MAELVQAKITVKGHVQGVFFRRHIKKHANDLKVNGYAKNLPTGEVEVLVQGPKNLIKELLIYCKEGSILSRVDNVDIEYQVLGKTYPDFTIIR